MERRVSTEKGVLYKEAGEMSRKGTNGIQLHSGGLFEMFIQLRLGDSQAVQHVHDLITAEDAIGF